MGHKEILVNSSLKANPPLKKKKRKKKAMVLKNSGERNPGPSWPSCLKFLW